MRIGVNCFLLQPNIGGIKQYFLTLFRNLLENDTENQYVFFWYEHNAAELANLGTERWKEGAVLLTDQREVLAHLDKIDLYFCPLSALYPRPLPKPSVVSLPDIQEVFYPEFFTKEDLYERDLHFPESTRMADRVLTLSEFSKQTMVQHHGLPPKKVIVAPISADPRFQRSEEIARPPAESLPEEFIFYPANFWMHKNHDGLLRALKVLKEERGLLVNVVLTGFPDTNGYPVEAKAVEYGVQKQVTRLGYVTVEEIAYLYRRARMLVFPSLFEGFGIPLLEAMTTGCPIAAADATSVPEVTGDVAVLFDPTSPASMAGAIERLWCEAGLRETLVAKGRVRAGQFSADRQLRAHLRAFVEAAHVYEYRDFLWKRWVYGPCRRTLLRLRWPERSAPTLLRILRLPSRSRPA
jgi:glycosyltransferase involved in cell wall biosynthesis